MMHGCKADSFRELTRVFRDGTLTGATDHLLLTRFVDHRDEAAFEVLMHRHGLLVLNICRKLLCDRHEVEDAFQATFPVLVRRAGSLVFEGSLAPWISTVAYRIAARARERRIRQNVRELKCGVPPDIPGRLDADHDETSRVVHEELGRLPERLRGNRVLLPGRNDTRACRGPAWLPGGHRAQPPCPSTRTTQGPARSPWCDARG